MKIVPPLRFPGLLALLASLMLAGCMTPSIDDPARTGPFFAPKNHSGEPTLGGIRRVVVLPIWGGALAPAESVAALDPIFVTALQQQNRFEVVVLSREECLRRFRSDSLGSASALPPELMSTLRRQFAADAVLFVDLTAFEPYRPLKLGLRAKLATIDDPRILWTFDNIFSAADPAVANAARQHSLVADRSSVPADLTPVVLQSPGRFAAYAASAMFSTLPPVMPVGGPVDAKSRN